MVSTRSSAKRKSSDESPAAPQPLSASTPKRRKLPLRKKTAKAPPADVPETDDGESPAEDGTEEADETLDLDAALQAQVAAENPTPIVGAAEARWQAAEDEDEDSDDEAPEAVSNVQAASRARDAAEAMKKAAREEADRLRQKRKDRDARLKEQALSRKVKEPSPQALPTALQEPAEQAETPAETTQPPEKPRTNPETTLLPDEFLASDSEAEPDAAPTPKRRKASKPKSAAPRDKRVGGTVYRVMKGADARMAPKGEGRSRQVRENLKKRGREGARKGGFVVAGKKVDWGTSRRC